MDQSGEALNEPLNWGELSGGGGGWRSGVELSAEGGDGLDLDERQRAGKEVRKED